MQDATCQTGPAVKPVPLKSARMVIDLLCQRRSRELEDEAGESSSAAVRASSFVVLPPDGEGLAPHLQMQSIGETRAKLPVQAGSAAQLSDGFAWSSQLNSRELTSTPSRSSWSPQLHRLCLDLSQIQSQFQHGTRPTSNVPLAGTHPHERSADHLGCTPDTGSHPESRISAPSHTNPPCTRQGARLSHPAETARNSSLIRTIRHRNHQHRLPRSLERQALEVPVPIAELGQWPRDRACQARKCEPRSSHPAQTLIFTSLIIANYKEP